MGLISRVSSRTYSTTMYRAQARERREYLYRKQLESQQANTQKRKQAIKRSLDKNTPIDGTLASDALSLQKSLNYDDSTTANQKIEGRSQDDEYRWAGVKDPKIAITTSRKPSKRLKEFCGEIKHMMPNSKRMNRGNNDMGQLVDICKKEDFSDLIILHETRGRPDGMIVSHFPYGPTIYFTLYNCLLRHDIEDVGTMSLQYPQLIFHNFESKIGNRISDCLKFLFPVAKPDGNRILTFKNSDDYISFRHHTFTLEGETSNRKRKDIVLKEVGPRFEMRPYRI